MMTLSSFGTRIPLGKLVMGAGLAGAVTLGLGSSLSQARLDCPRPPQMDARYCDRVGDLVADLPEDPSEWVDPEVLLVSYTSSEEPAVYANTWAEFTAHLEEVTGRRVQFVPADSQAAQYEAMRAGRLHIMGTCTGCTPVAVNVAGFVPFAIFQQEDGSIGYDMEVITHVNSDIQALDDIAGRRVAFTHPSSNSGYISARILIKQETGLDDEAGDYIAEFSGSHQNSILGVFNEDYDAAPIANDVLNRMCLNEQVDCSQFRSLYKSETFPSGSFGHAHNLHPELAERIREAFFTFEFEGTAMRQAFNRVAFAPITYQENWEIIRRIQEEEGVEYTL